MVAVSNHFRLSVNEPNMPSLLLNAFLAVFVSHSGADTGSGFLPGGGSLDTLAEDSALKSFGQLHPHTGSLNQALLPANFSGMKVSVLRLRSRTLWMKGTNVSGFSIPPRTVTVPHVQRMLIVCQDLGNWSNWYYAGRLHGYSLATSVMGLAVYDASDANSTGTVPVDLDTRGNLILVQFPNRETSGVRSTYGGKCLLIRRDGTMSLTDIINRNMCHSEDQGKFAVVVETEKKGGRRYRAWVISAVVGSIGLFLVTSCFLGWLLIRVHKLAKARVMKRWTDEEEVFASIWVADSKMPYATVTRTQPALEN